MPKFQLPDATFIGISIRDGKENAGGTYAVVKLTCRITAAMRKSMDWGSDDAQWPPNGETGGNLAGELNATGLSLASKQKNLDGNIPDEVDAEINRVDDFKWKQVEEGKSKVCFLSMSARTNDPDSVAKLAAFKFAIQSGNVKGSISYNKPGEGTLVDMTPHAEDGQASLPN